jgi:hypothetical protein
VLDAATSPIDSFLERSCISSTQLIGLFGAKWAYLYLETPNLQGVFLSKTNSILKGKQCATYFASNTECFLSRDTCVSSTQRGRPIWNTMALLTLKTMICMKYLCKLTRLTGKNVTDDPDSTHTVFNREINLFFNSTESTYLEKNEPFPTLKGLICRKYFFQKLPQLSNWKNVLDATASNIGGLYCRDKWLSSTQLYRPFWSKQIPPTPENYDLTQDFLSITKSVLSLKQSARYFIF